MSLTQFLCSTCLGNRTRIVPRSPEATRSSQLPRLAGLSALRSELFWELHSQNTLPLPVQGPVVADDDILSRNSLPDVPASGNLLQPSQSKFCLGCAFCTVGVWSREPRPEASLPFPPSSAVSLPVAGAVQVPGHLAHYVWYCWPSTKSLRDQLCELH